MEIKELTKVIKHNKERTHEERLELLLKANIIDDSGCFHPEYFSKETVERDRARQTKTTSKEYKESLSRSSELLTESLAAGELVFVEHEQYKPEIPTVLTSTQIKQIMEAPEGVDLRSRCRVVYLLNEQLYNAGVKEILK